MEETLKEVSMEKARANLSSLVDTSRIHGTQHVLTRYGRPVAVLISMEVFEVLKKQNEPTSKSTTPD